MIELIIERWSDLGGTVSYRWSLWRDGQRTAMGRSAFANAEDCEADASAYCSREHGSPPERVTRL